MQERIAVKKKLFEFLRTQAEEDYFYLKIKQMVKKIRKLKT